MTTAVQNQDYYGDRNPFNHTTGDTYEKINPTYMTEEIKATTAIAGYLTEPIALEHKIRLPFVLFIR